MDDGGCPNKEGLIVKMKRFFGRLDDDVTEEEIMSMVHEGHEQGVIEASEAEMIHNIFEFGDKNAKDIMTHRKNVIALNEELLFEEALDVILQENYSRFPVYAEDIDNVVGVLHIKEVLAASHSGQWEHVAIKDIPGLIRTIDFVPETNGIHALFRKMQEDNSHMAIVIDEYGQTAGLVAMEDILEEIVGNIFDEHDEVDLFIEKKRDGSYIMKGEAPFEEVAECLGIESEDSDFDTLNGYLVSLIDKIPADGERFKVEADGYEFRVLKVEDKMIQLVKVVKTRKKEDDTN